MSDLVVLGEKQQKVFDADFNHTLEVLEGTPRSGKTTVGHFRYAKYLLGTRETNHLIVAYNQEQAYRLFIDGDGTGLEHIFAGYSEIKHGEHGSHLSIQLPKGTRNVFFKGGGKSNSVGAITGMSLGSVVFCEIDLLHMSMIQECLRRTFASRDRFHLADLNPPSPHHPVIREVFDVQDTKWDHFTIKDNPIISEERKDELRETLSKNPYLYARDWEGKRVNPQGVIYSVFDFDDNQIPSLIGKPYEMYFACDAGQADSTVVTCNIVTWIKKEKKFRLNQMSMFYHSGKDTGQVRAMSRYAKDIKDFVKWCVDEYDMMYTNFFVDPAAKSLREELHLVGIDTMGADNNRIDSRRSGGGIEVGIERVQNAMINKQFMLVDTDKYSHYGFLKEVSMYCRNDAGHPIDEYNDVMDTVRYATNYFYKNYIT